MQEQLPIQEQPILTQDRHFLWLYSCMFTPWCASSLTAFPFSGWRPPSPSATKRSPSKVAWGEEASSCDILRVHLCRMLHRLPEFSFSGVRTNNLWHLCTITVWKVWPDLTLPACLLPGSQPDLTSPWRNVCAPPPLPSPSPPPLHCISRWGMCVCLVTMPLLNVLIVLLSILVI